MWSANRTIPDIEMVVHQSYEWIRKHEVVGWDYRRCKVPGSDKSRC
jgi:hypothetical protein